MVKRHPSFQKPKPSILTLTMPQEMRDYLALEAKRLSEERGKRVSVQKLLRALITSYRERRIAGLITSPDD